MFDNLVRVASAHPELYVGGCMIVALVIFLIGALNDRP